MAEQWPTSEMISRGTKTTFLAGIPIAFFSGLGVALSVLDESTSSLVGVAISASLLPPAGKYIFMMFTCKYTRFYSNLFLLFILQSIAVCCLW